jgi:hypothetical protein
LESLNLNEFGNNILKVGSRESKVFYSGIAGMYLLKNILKILIVAEGFFRRI